MSSDPKKASANVGPLTAPRVSDPAELAGHIRFTRIAIGMIALANGVTLLESMRLLLVVGHWQYIVIIAVGLGFMAMLLGASRLARRGLVDIAIERVFIGLTLVILLVPLWFEQVETMLAAFLIFFTLVAAPRLLTLERADRWVYIAVTTGLLLSAMELVPLPTRLPAERQYDLPFELTVLTAMVCFAGLAFRDSRRFPVRTKLFLAFFVIALAPLAILSYDASRKVVTSQQATARDELGDGAATTAFLWSSWFDNQRERIIWLASSPLTTDACSGEPEAVDRTATRLQPLLPGLRGAALWSRGGKRLLAVGEAPTRPLPAGAFLGHHQDGGLVLAQPACDGGSLTVALPLDALDNWTHATAQRHRAAVVVRDASGRLLAGVADDALLAALPVRRRACRLDRRPPARRVRPARRRRPAKTRGPRLHLADRHPRQHRRHAPRARSGRPAAAALDRPHPL